MTVSVLAPICLAQKVLHLSLTSGHKHTLQADTLRQSRRSANMLENPFFSHIKLSCGYKAIILQLISSKKDYLVMYPVGLVVINWLLPLQTI